MAAETYGTWINPYLALTIAIIAEAGGTTLLKLSNSFTIWYYALGSLLCYLVAITFLSFSLYGIALGIAYAIWSGIGTVFAVLVGFFLFKESLDWLQIFGIFIIIIGVVLTNISYILLGEQ